MTFHPNNPDLGRAMHRLITELYPIPRSITGEGVRRSLRLLQAVAPLEIREIASGTKVFDWTVPDEWNVHEAHLTHVSTGRRFADFSTHSLHLVGYSTPVRRRMTLAELRPHLHSLPDKPGLIPYRTAYYKPTWGFCLSHDELTAMPEGEYDVVIDSTLAPGSLTCGEFFIPGQTEEEIFFSAHTCHPQLANDNLSGMVVAAFLARQLAAGPRRKHSIRCVWAPGTIGAISWLAMNERITGRIKHGLILSCLGDGRTFTYKRSRRGESVIDSAVAGVLRDSGKPHHLMDFSPYGYDERQYCSPGFDLPVGLLMNSQYGTFPEYHTSADDLALVKPEALADSLNMVLRVIDAVEAGTPEDGRPSSEATIVNTVDTGDARRRYMNLLPKCEPQLGRRGLFSAVGGRTSPKEFELAMLWVLNQSDGERTLGAIARRSGLSIEIVYEAAVALEKAMLLREIHD